MQNKVVGHVGVHGHHAVNPVGRVLENVLEGATIQSPVMAGETAQDQRWIPKLVIISHALVRNINCVVQI